MAQTTQPALQLNGQTGEVEAQVQGGERIFSRDDTRQIVRLAEQGPAADAQLGQFVHEALVKQDARPPEYTKS